MFRRGNITVPQKWGNKVSVLAGDFMYSVALNTGDPGREPGHLPPHGERAPRTWSWASCASLNTPISGRASREHYLTIIELKTARFMGSCAKLGATKSGLDAAENANCSTASASTWASRSRSSTTPWISCRNPTRSARTWGAISRTGKSPSPSCYFIETGGPEALKTLKRYIDNPDPGLWQSIIKQLAGAGAIDYSVRFAGEYIDQARGILGQFPDSPFRKILFELSDFLLSRTY